MKIYKGYVEVDENNKLRFALDMKDNECFTMFAKSLKRARATFSSKSKVAKATLLVETEDK